MRGEKTRVRVGLLGVIIILFVVVCALITFGKPLGIPGWDDIFAALDLDESISYQDEMPLMVHYIDVGQGDCILIESDGKTMLVDCGERDNAQTIATYIDKRNIKKLDYAVITHPHSDHMGSMEALMDLVEIDKIIMKKLPKNMIPTHFWYKNFTKKLQKFKGQTLYINAGDEFKLGSADIKILAPTKDYTNLNNTSIVFKLSYGGKDFLFTGDAESTSEKDMISGGEDLSADVLKLGHHGSSTSTSKNFLKAVSPEYAVAMCGVDNQYNHPHDKIIDRLKESNVKLLRTDLEGSIVIGSDGKKIAVYDNDSSDKVSKAA